MEKLLLEACLQLAQSDALVGIQDMGAAGLVSSASEMAAKAGTGIEMNLADVPQREADMTPYEIMLSESQERMLAVVEAGREQEIEELFAGWGLHATAVGQVTEARNLCLYHHGEGVADIPVDALAEEAPVNHLPAVAPSVAVEEASVPEVDDIEETFLTLLAQPAIASKRWVYEQYDSMIGTNTVNGPGADAAVLRIRGTRKALAISTDCNARYLQLDPEIGGQIAVAEAARNIVCSGAEPLAITDCLNFGNPEKPEVMGQLQQAAAGISDACRTLETPVVSGNVSLYNETNEGAIAPTPVIGMVGLLKDLDHITGCAFQHPGDLIYVMGKTYAEFGGSELQKTLAGDISGKAPGMNLEQESNRQTRLRGLIQDGVISSAHDLAEGGLAVALAEAVMGSEMGAEITLTTDPIPGLFSETQSRFLVSIPAEQQDRFETQVDEAVWIGRVTETARLHVTDRAGGGLIDVSATTMRSTWEGAIPCLMQTTV